MFRLVFVSQGIAPGTALYLFSESVYVYNFVYMIINKNDFMLMSPAPVIK